MVKMGVPISKNAKAILLQEDKLKNYKMHLELCIHEFDETKDILPKIWQPLFKEHYCQMSKEFQPGLSSLSWNSLNIGMHFLIFLLVVVFVLFLLLYFAFSCFLPTKIRFLFQFKFAIFKIFWFLHDVCVCV